MIESVFDLFKIGIGPSSSHTVGPMVAASRFLEKISDISPSRISVTLYGSLAFTGRGHGSDTALVLGLSGYRPENVDPAAIEGILNSVRNRRQIVRPGASCISFDEARDLRFDTVNTLPLHANAMLFRAIENTEHPLAEYSLVEQIYYSVGGGFVATQEELSNHENSSTTTDHCVPYPFRDAAELLKIGRDQDCSIAQIQYGNERALNPGTDIDTRIDEIWNTMYECMNRGLSQTGELPGILKVKRRSAEIFSQLKTEPGDNNANPHRIIDWLSVYAMAVNEENAAGGRVVTAPTNGASGVIPSVIRYVLEFCPKAKPRSWREFLLVAAAIGGIVKRNASISGAEVGCQGEVGTASAMAASGLCAVLGGNNAQVENAAEIALEHHLGMTCDPIAGLVQVPCIERNALGATKAVAAATLALRGNGEHMVSLDCCIETMRQTGLEMSTQFKETSLGGLAKNFVSC